MHGNELALTAGPQARNLVNHKQNERLKYIQLYIVFFKGTKNNTIFWGARFHLTPYMKLSGVATGALLWVGTLHDTVNNSKKIFPSPCMDLEHQVTNKKMI